MATTSFVTSPTLSPRLGHLYFVAAPTRRNTVVAMDHRDPNLRRRRSRAVAARAARTSPNNTHEAIRTQKSVPVRVALELAQAGYTYLDVRTPDQFDTAHPYGAINVPYMYRVGSGLTKNRSFIRQVSSYFRQHDEIIVGSESGEMSVMASVDLLSSGFTAVTNIAGGFMAWSENGLPLEE